MASVEEGKAEGQVLETAPSLVGKLEGAFEIKSEAGDFHDVFSCRPHHIPNVTPENIQGCRLHEGDYGTPGSTIVWDYVHDGIKSYAKDIVEAIDHENNSTTFKVIEGDLMQLYKDFRIIVQATPKKEGQGSIVHWTLEYEKLHDGIPDPTSFMDFCHAITKDIDLHLQEAADSTAAAPATTTTAADSTAQAVGDEKAE